MLRKLRSENGVALPVATAVLLTVSLLAVAVANNAMQSSDSANTDRNSKRALAAAEAGLQTAANRLNLLNPSGEMCLTDGPVPLDGAECPGHPEQIGNGAEFTYWVTPELTSGVECSESDTCAERVITSVGTVHGETRRLQTRLESRPVSLPLFPVAGMLGMTQVRFENNSRVTGNTGSNGLIYHPVGSVSAVELGGPPYTTPVLPRRPPPVIYQPSRFTLPPVPIGDTAEHNVNNLIETNARVSYDEGTRDLRVENGILVLPPGDYNFCRVRLYNNAEIVVTGPVRMFIDAPSDVRRGSGCPANGGDPLWGTFHTFNRMRINMPPSPVVNFQLYVWGWPPGGAYARRYGENMVEFDNNTDFYGSIFAPNSKVWFKNATAMEGAISANSIQFDNASNFTWHDGFDEVGESGGQFEREAWVECRPKPADPDDPESGC